MKDFQKLNKYRYSIEYFNRINLIKLINFFIKKFDCLFKNNKYKVNGNQYD